MSKMSDNQGKTGTRASHYVLVHGASHGAWCWYKVQTLLQEAGHTVTCVDLKSAGIDPTNADTLFKFDDYNQPLLSVFSSLPESQKVILVGHSLGGFNVTHALYNYTNKVQVAVYLAAAMVKKTTSTFSIGNLSSSKPYQPLSEITTSALDPSMFEWGYGLGPGGPPTSMIMKKEYQRQFYYNMSPLEDSTLAGMLLKPFPVLAMTNFNLPDGMNSEVEKVPRVYIRTLHDNMMSPESHDKMINGWPPVEVLEIDSDHSAFFSNPTQLCHMLLKVASKYA